MAYRQYPPALTRLIEALGRLPGIGPKTAQRLALHLLQGPREPAETLALAIKEAKERTRFCTVCYNLCEAEICHLCRDETRDGSALCVVERPGDVIAMERTREFHGRYHVLHGAISPMDGVGPEQLRIRELLHRIGTGGVAEVILATNPTVEGEATALYLARLVKPLGVRVTRLARGIPEGGDLDYVDELTLTRALEGRREFGSRE